MTILSTPPSSRLFASYNDRHFQAAKVQTVVDEDVQVVENDT